MLIAILRCCTVEELEESDSDDARTTAMIEATDNEDAAAQRRAAIKNKILAVGRMRRMFQVLRFVLFRFSFSSIFVQYCFKQWVD